jgi:hypothetical protein
MNGEIMLRKPLVGAAVCIIAIAGVGSSAFAGEVNGNGNPTPILGEEFFVPGVPASACAYSGLEDDAGGGPGVTQTPHSEGGNTSEPGVARACSHFNSGKNGTYRD